MMCGEKQRSNDESVCYCCIDVDRIGDSYCSYYNSKRLGGRTYMFQLFYLIILKLDIVTISVMYRIEVIEFLPTPGQSTYQDGRTPKKRYQEYQAQDAVQYRQS